MIINYSIIIPHYDMPGLLSRCLKSIPRRNDLQIIVVDDQSPGNDNYLQIIPELSRDDVEFYIADKKLGAGHARNIGLKYAKGKKLIFSDSDDFFSDEFDKILDEYVNDESDIVYFNCYSVNSDDISSVSNRTKDNLFKEYEACGDLRLFKEGFTEPWGKIIKRTFVERYGIEFEETMVANDHMFSIKTGFLAQSVKAVNKRLCVVTTRDGSLSYKMIDTIEKLQTRIEVMGRVQVFLASYGVTKDPMYVFDGMVNMSHRNPKLFVKDLFLLHRYGVPISRLLYEILVYRVLSPQKWQRKKTNQSNYV